VTALVDKAKGKFKAILQIIAKAIVEIFSVTMLIKAIDMVRIQIATGQTSPSLHLPMWVPYFSLVLGFGIISLVQGTTLMLLLIQLFMDNRRASPKEAHA